MKKIYLFCLIAFGLLACKKSTSTVNPEPISQLATINTIRSLNLNGHWILSKHSYIMAKKLAKQIITDESTGLEITQQYGYNNGLLESSDIIINSKKLNKITYSLTFGVLSAMTYLEYDEQQNLTLNFQLKFDYVNGQIYKITTIHSDGSEGDYRLFSFESGNVKDIKTYTASGQLTSIDSYSYDQKINPEQGFPDHNQSATGYSNSNIINSTRVDYRNNNATTIQTYSYEYNPDGQPTKRYLVQADQQRSLQAIYRYN